MNTDHGILNELGKINISDEEGKPMAFSNLWREKRAAIVFVRHFG